MGYTITKNAILRVQKYLEAMVATNETIEWVTETPAKLAHRIHEGIKAAEEFQGEGEPYSTFAKLRHKFVIRQKTRPCGSRVARGITTFSCRVYFQ